MSLEEIEMFFKWLTYNGKENDKLQNTSHIRYRISEPEFPRIIQRLFGDYGKCDNIELPIIDDVYPRIMDWRGKVQRV
jgi:hypothetical protein